MFYKHHSSYSLEPGMLSQRIFSFPVNSNLEGTEISKAMLSNLLSILLYFV